MATPLGTTFVTDEQIVAQGDVLYKGKMVESLVVEFDQAKYEEFLSSGSKSPKTRVCRRVSTGTCPETRSVTLSGAAAAKGVAANCAKQDTRANVSQEARVVPGTTALRPAAPCGTHASTSLTRPVWSKSLVSSQSTLYLSTKLSLVSLHLHDATETLSVDKGGVRV